MLYRRIYRNSSLLGFDGVSNRHCQAAQYIIIIMYSKNKLTPNVINICRHYSGITAATSIVVDVVVAQ